MSINTNTCSLHLPHSQSKDGILPVMSTVIHRLSDEMLQIVNKKSYWHKGQIQMQFPVTNLQSLKVSIECNKYGDIK